MGPGSRSEARRGRGRVNPPAGDPIGPAPPQARAGVSLGSRRGERGETRTRPGSPVSHLSGNVRREREGAQATPPDPSHTALWRLVTLLNWRVKSTVKLRYEQGGWGGRRRRPLLRRRSCLLALCEDAAIGPRRAEPGAGPGRSGRPQARARPPPPSSGQGRPPSGAGTAARPPPARMRRGALRCHRCNISAVTLA